MDHAGHVLAPSVVEDVARIRSLPLASRKIPIFGDIYDVRTGPLIEEPPATEAGRPSHVRTARGKIEQN